MLSGVKVKISGSDMERIVAAAEGYSCSDLSAVVKEAAMGPVREKEPEELMNLTKDSLRAVRTKDFATAFKNVRPSVTEKTRAMYTEWERENAAGAF